MPLPILLSKYIEKNVSVVVTNRRALQCLEISSSKSSRATRFYTEALVYCTFPFVINIIETFIFILIIDRILENKFQH